MKALIASPLAALALGLAGSVQAATPVNAGNDLATCQALMHQFDQAAPAHNEAPKMIEARAKRSTAESACKSGNYKGGIMDIRAALNDIGVKPVQQAALQ
jgi:hypothetical protein